MRGPVARPVVIAAGGTGGHFFPAEALMTELIARGHRVVLMTDARAAARNTSAFQGREHYIIHGAGLAGRGMFRAGAAAGSLLAGVAQARFLLARLDPAAVAAFGGYASVAPVLAARSLRRRPAIILHEQNAVLGRANRFLSRYADVLALSFADSTGVPSSARSIAVGNPVRSEFRFAAYEPPGKVLNVLVLGGSLGARVFSDVVPGALVPGMRVVQQCRPEDLARVREAYARAGIGAELATFFPDMAERLAWAHLVIARAGASTVAELAVAGRPAILVPLPTAVDDHQAANARSLERAGAAWIMPQASFTPDSLRAHISSLLAAPSRLVQAAEAAGKVARPNAAQLLADHIDASSVQENRA
ncbi:MAG: undecaprenyldiphospho-muramoylpentapeptide beta-N-acetylglucosaminyltransferase [Acetobacteraceae bacterium]|nr:undecaprenyldiphospho-muramoylpentapeptide beta-N-acetylglucosaminyltransferase [Acetobacteraceae bacterium]